MKRIYPIRVKKCKYGTGGTVNDYSTIPDIGTATQAATGGVQGGASTMNQDKGLTSAQTTGAISAGLVGAANTASVYSNPNSTTRQQTESINNTATGVVGAINPVVGTAIGAGNQIGQSIRSNAEQFDENGNLKDKQKAKNTAIAGSFFDPLQAMTTRFSYKGGLTDLDGSKYAANLEKEQRKALGITEPVTPTTKFKKGGKVKHNPLVDPLMYMQTGGNVDSTMINAEKDEIIVNPQNYEVIKDLKPLPSHPNVGINPLGNTIAPIGSVVIPKKQRSRYLNSDPSHKKLMLNGLQLKDSMNKMKYGGAVKKYGGPEGSVVREKPYYDFNNPNAPLMEQYFPDRLPYKEDWLNPNVQMYDPNTPGKYYNPNREEILNMNKTPNMNITPMTPKGFNIPTPVIKETMSYPSTTITENTDNSGYKMQPIDYLAPIGSAIASSAGAIDYLMRNKGPSDTKFKLAESKYLDPSGAIKEINNSFAGVDYSLKNIGTGNYLSNRIESGARKADAVSKVVGDYANRNSEIYNQGEQFNTQIKNNEIIANEQNKSAYEMARKGAIDNITGSMAGASKDILQYKRDIQRLGLVGDTINYHYDQEGNEFVYKGSKKQYTGRTKP